MEKGLTGKPSIGGFLQSSQGKRQNLHLTNAFPRKSREFSYQLEDQDNLKNMLDRFKTTAQRNALPSIYSSHASNRYHQRSGGKESGVFSMTRALGLSDRKAGIVNAARQQLDGKRFKAGDKVAFLKEEAPHAAHAEQAKEVEGAAKEADSQVNIKSQISLMLGNHIGSIMNKRKPENMLKQNLGKAFKAKLEQDAPKPAFQHGYHLNRDQAVIIELLADMVE